jgi:hypothetical protein
MAEMFGRLALSSMQGEHPDAGAQPPPLLGGIANVVFDGVARLEVVRRSSWAP